MSLFAASARVDGGGGEERLSDERLPQGPQADQQPLKAQAATGVVRQGCIASHLIRRVSFDDDRTGTLELVGRQRVRLTLRNACSGIRFNGYVHKPVNRRFCEGDILRVMDSGGFCVVDSLEQLADDALVEEQSTAVGKKGSAAQRKGTAAGKKGSAAQRKGPAAEESSTGQR